MEEIALLANTAATFTMVGIIWFVQRVHYPLLALVKVDQAIEVAEQHQQRTGQVVGLPMAIEGITTLVLLVTRPDAVPWIWPWIGALLLAVSLGATIFLSVPLHAQMASRPDENVGQRLVSTNWVRTISWSGRGIICLVMCTQAL